MSQPIIVNPANPKLMDELLIRVNDKLKQQFTWLTHAFGIVQRMQRKDDHKKYIDYPAIFTGTDQEYISVMPHEPYGNFSFWDLGDYTREKIDNQLQKIKAPFAFIVWMNLKDVLATDELRNLENVKEDFLNFFDQNRFIRGRIDIELVTDDPKKIYKGYTLKQAEQQYLMHPFAAIRLEGMIEYERLCNS